MNAPDTNFVVRYNNVQKMHQELASLYKTKSKDVKRIELLWKRIEEGEHVLRTIDGLNID